MAFVLKDRVKETSTTTGTGTITLGGASAGYQGFSTVGNANTTFYSIVMGTEWENGVGTYTSSGSALSRDTVLSSSNSGSLVNFSAGTKDVFVNYPAGRASLYDTPSQSTGAFHIPVGTTDQRPTGASGMIRINTSLGYPEWYDGTNLKWQNFYGPPIIDYSVDYLVVAGGGGGGGFGGGGAGGYRELTSQTVTNGTAYTITVGAGGSGTAVGSAKGTSGSNSVFSSTTSAGGGGGGAFSDANAAGASGGSGGGGGTDSSAPYTGRAGGSGDTPSTSPSQGNNGGSGATGGAAGGGGGGASAVGAAGSGSNGGNGGNGTASSISGSSVTRGGGGGGGGLSVRGAGGSGGGGQGGISPGGSGVASGTANTGGGGGGGYASAAGNGGSGVIIIKIADTATVTFSGGVTQSSVTSGGFKIYTITATSTTSETVTFT